MDVETVELEDENAGGMLRRKKNDLGLCNLSRVKMKVFHLHVLR